MAFKVIDLDSGKVVYEKWKSPTGEARGYSPLFSPDGKFLATRIGTQATLWNTTDWTRITDFSVGTQSFGMSFSSDSTMIAISSLDKVTIWKWENHQQLREITWCGDKDNTPQAIFSPDNAYIAILNCGEISAWKIDNGIQVFQEYTAFINITGMSLVTDAIPTIYEPKLKPGVIYAPWNTWWVNPSFEFIADKGIYQLNFVVYSNIILGWSNLAGFACSITFNGIHVGQKCEEGSYARGEGNLYTAATEFLMGNDGNIYRSYRDFMNHRIELRQGLSADGNLFFSFKYPGLYGGTFAIDPAHQLLFYEIINEIPRGTSYVMDMATSRNLQNWPAMTLPPNQVSYSADGKLAAFFLNATTGTQMVVYDLENRRTVYWAFKPAWNEYGAAFSPDSKFLAHYFYSPQDSQPDFFYIMEIAKPTRATRFSFDQIPDHRPTAIRYSPQGSLLAIGFSNGIVRLFDTSNGLLLYEWQANNVYITALAFTPDGKYLASASRDGTIRIWGVWP